MELWRHNFLTLQQARLLLIPMNTLESFSQNRSARMYSDFLLFSLVAIISVRLLIIAYNWISIGFLRSHRRHLLLLRFCQMSARRRTNSWGPVRLPWSRLRRDNGLLRIRLKNSFYELVIGFFLVFSTCLSDVDVSGLCVLTRQDACGLGSCLREFTLLVFQSHWRHLYHRWVWW